MKLDAFRDAVLAQSRDRADVRRSDVRKEADRRLSEARDRAREVTRAAEADGRSIAAGEMARVTTAARRRARENVLAARRQVFEEFRRRVIASVKDRWTAAGDDGWPRALEDMARRQLGNGLTIEPDVEAGGFIARLDGRVVDYRVPVVVDRTLDEMNFDVEVLWR